MSTHTHHPHTVAHEPPADARAMYTRAYDAAQPDSGRSMVHVDLEAREFDWTVAPGRTFRAWG